MLHRLSMLASLCIPSLTYNLLIHLTLLNLYLDRFMILVTILRNDCSIVTVCIQRASNTVKKTQLQYIIFWFYNVLHFRQCRRQYDKNSTEVRNAIGIGRLVLCFIYGYVGCWRGEGSTTVWTSGVKIFLPESLPCTATGCGRQQKDDRFVHGKS